MWHRVDEALRVDLVLQNSCLIPGLIDCGFVVVAEFPIWFLFVGEREDIFGFKVMLVFNEIEQIC